MLLLHRFKLLMEVFGFVLVERVTGDVSEGLNLLLSVVAILLTALVVVPGTVMVHA